MPESLRDISVVSLKTASDRCLGFVDGPNLYTYVRQNPWTAFDPEGLEALAQGDVNQIRAAISAISGTKLGQTDYGKHLTTVLTSMLKSGNIDKEAYKGGPGSMDWKQGQYNRDSDKLTLNKNMFDAPGQLPALLGHEGTHKLQGDQNKTRPITREMEYEAFTVEDTVTSSLNKSEMRSRSQLEQYVDMTYGSLEKAGGKYEKTKNFNQVEASAREAYIENQKPATPTQIGSEGGVPKWEFPDGTVRKGGTTSEPPSTDAPVVARNTPTPKAKTWDDKESK